MLRKDKRVKEMNEMIRKRNEQLAKTVIKGLQSRNMSGYYAEDKEAAAQFVPQEYKLSLIHI